MDIDITGSPADAKGKGNVKKNGTGNGGNGNKFRWFSKAQTIYYTPEGFASKLYKLQKYCLIHLDDSYKVHLNRLKGLELLEELLERVQIPNINGKDMMRLTWCCLSCVHHFYIRFTTGHGFMDWSRRRQARRAMKVYETLISLVSSEQYGGVVHAIIKFYTEAKMWRTEALCADLLRKLLDNRFDSETTVHAILDVVEKSGNVREARQVLRVLYQILNDFHWPKIQTHLIVRLLTMVYKSIMPNENDLTDFTPLRKGLEVCLRHLLENIPNSSLLKIIKTMLQWTCDDAVSDEALLDFGNILEYAAILHETLLYKESLHNKIFPLLLKLISSENRLHSLLGNRVLQLLMDRHSNKSQFDTPKIYFDDMVYDIVSCRYNAEDKTFIKTNREIIHRTLLASIQLHGVHRINLESTYATIAIIVVEIPCGYTAAAIVCLAMAIQEYTISDTDLQMDCSNRMHAVVMAIMSLVCWVHSAQVFYDYLKVVVTRRAKFAPHLNPPLRTRYEYAQHHVVWNKPELFFEDWEARYGLWKCFRSTKTKNGSIRVNDIKNTDDVHHDSVNVN